MQRVIGYALIAVAIVGLIATFSTLDTASARWFSLGGLSAGFSLGTSFFGLPVGLVVAALVGIALIGAGLLLFGGKREP